MMRGMTMVAPLESVVDVEVIIALVKVVNFEIVEGTN
jgi:hypothetical protein